MSSEYPYISDTKCKNCQDIVIVKQKRDKSNAFCSKDCYNQYRRRGKPIKLNLSTKYICLKCKEVFEPGRNTLGMYCSYACSNGSKSVKHKLVCKCCNKDFFINNIAEIKRGHYQYCSNECRKRKYTINESCFNEIDEVTSYWIGFVWASIYDNKYNKISFLSKLGLLERFNTFLQSSYPIKKSNNDKYVLKITSLHILNRLVEVGINSSLYLEFPNIAKLYHKDFIRGYFDSDQGYYYKDNGMSVAVLHGKSSKLMRSISHYLESKLIIDKGEWATISFDFYDRVYGNPLLINKWDKFV